MIIYKHKVIVDTEDVIEGLLVMLYITFCIVYTHENRFVLTGLISNGYAYVSNYGVSVLHTSTRPTYLHTHSQNKRIFHSLWLFIGLALGL